MNILQAYKLLHALGEAFLFYKIRNLKKET